MIATIAQAAVSLTQSIELSILVKATLMLALGLIAVRLALRAPASVRHLLLAVTFAGLFVLPLATLAVPGVVIQVPVADASAAPAISSALPPPDAPPIAARVDARQEKSRAVDAIATLWPSAVRAAWLAGVTTLCLSLGLAFGRLRRLRRDGVPRPELQELVQSLAREAGIRRPVGVVEHEDIAAPLTCGLWHPAILLPIDSREWNGADLQRALVHELEHVRRGDWAIQLAARVACACYWFHPLAWVAFRQLCLEAERACDDAVVRSAERTDYADQLVLLARRLSQPHAPMMLGMANRSDLAARVTALLDEHQRRGRAGALAAASVVLGAGLVVTAIAPVRAIAAPATEMVATVADAASGAGGQNSGRNGRVRVRGLDRALYEAAENGDLEDVDQLLQAGANVNAAIDGDGSPLIAAARENRLAVVRRLLDRGADPNMPVEGDGSPLIAAAGEGAAAVVALLLARGAQIDLMVPGDENALIQASGNGHLEVVTLLIARGADVNARVWVESARATTGEWRTPLSMARKGGHAAVVQFLLAAGARE